jgi:hypothetical protein
MLFPFSSKVKKKKKKKFDLLQFGGTLHSNFNAL